MSEVPSKENSTPVHTINVTIACLAGLALLMTLFAHGLRLRWLNEPLLALALGVLIGPKGLGWLDLAQYGEEREIIETVARFTLVIVLVAVGVELRGYVSAQWRPLSVLVLGGAALMWGVSTLLVWWIAGLELFPSILVGAVLAPTDPILSATVSTGRVARETLPERTRNLLSAESSARHGIGLVLVLLPALLIVEPDSEAWRHWLTDVLLWKGLVAVIIGGVAGYVVGRLQAWSAARDYTETVTGPLAALFLALALGLASTVELMKIDGALAVLVAGVVYARVRSRGGPKNKLDEEHRDYQHVIKQVLQVPIFALFGAALPWDRWEELGWKGPALVVAILLLRRIPAVLLLKPVVGQLRGWSEALFVGWFGPVGVGALFFAAVATKETHDEQIWTIVTLIIAATIVAHDLTATPLSQWLGRRTSHE
jgi:NhaP-type Na+/H+ or K+/H+ antiporter